MVNSMYIDNTKNLVCQSCKPDRKELELSIQLNNSFNKGRNKNSLVIIETNH